MKISLRLHGTLPEYFPGTYPDSGLDIEVGENITVADLVKLIQIPQEQVSIVSINGVLSRADDTIPDGALVKFFQSIRGG